MQKLSKDRSLSTDCINKIGEEVLLRGWVQTTRTHGKIAFFDLRDRSSLIQIVATEGELVRKITQLGQQDVVEVVGVVKQRAEQYKNPNLKTGEVEVEASGITIIAKAAEMPFDMAGKDLALELPTLLDNRSLTLRHQKVSSIFKVAQTLVESFRNTLKKEGFTEIFVPTLVKNAPEGGAQVFGVDYYQHKAFLAQSPQLYKQIMVSIYERVFTIAHAYRAEPSVTTRHLSEYISLDAEMGFIDSFNDIMDVAEKVIKNMFADLSEKNSDELKIHNAKLPKIEKAIPRIKMREAQEIIFKRTKRDHRSEPDLDPSDEKEICEWVREESGTPFVFITHYPTKKRPFYTMPDASDPEYTFGFDLLGIQEEWVTGGQRINGYQMLLDHIHKWKNKPEDFELYLQSFRYGMPPEGGFAMGLERIAKDILGLENVREASLFPRDMERIDEKL